MDFWHHHKSCSKTKYASIILLSAFSEKLEKFNLINYYELSKLDNAITQSRFLNRTELKTKGDTNSNSSIAKPWRLCSVQQVEDHKSLIRICPILSTSIFFEELYRDPNEVESPTSSNHRSPHWTTIHNPSKIHDSLYTSLHSLLFHPINWILYTIWQKLSHQSPTPCKRIALDHVFNALRMLVAALFESKRLKITKTNPLTYGCCRH